MSAIASPVLLFLLLVGTPATAGISGQAGESARPAIIPVDAQQVRTLVSESPGRVVLLNVWATWCVPCVEEFPDLVKLRSVYAKRGLEVRFISIDHPGKAMRAVQTFLTKMNVDFPTYIKSAGSDESFITALHPEWSGAVPATFVYDRTGKLVHTRVDAQTYEEFVSLVEPLLVP